MGSRSSGSSSMATFRQHVDESHHDLVNLLTLQMTTILNPVMLDHKSKFECLARQVERIVRIVDYDEGFMNQPYFVSTFSAVMQATEVSRGMKNPKIVKKFAGEIGESTTEHISRYMVKLEILANGENLKMKFIPSSLTKNAFTCFSNLRPNSIVTWAQLENTFHSQFFRGKLNVTVTDLVALKREDRESIDDFMIRLKNVRI
ncbi:hypothetical protein Ahy_A08g038373 [Arachis hypogaea]|uniref:Retrotransposon gag domain-containing protein n=1 Tax=Arachis hypogaea TaxID=3818 RepID=A0A445BTA4_ARAHY|nr:hypothetical protein Ahy_A08g038373 [Arachis hypogaea]